MKAGWRHFLFAALALLTSCEAAIDPADVKKPRYYDVAGFLEQAVAELEKGPTSLTKTITDKNTGTQSTRLEHPDWKAELEPFREAELNRPAWRNAFSIDSVGHADGTHVLTYRRIEGQNVPLKEAVLHLSPERTIQRMLLVLEDNNMLFYTLKRLSLETVPGSNAALKQYTISGDQKMIASDSVKYQVKGTVHRATFSGKSGS